MKWTDRIGRRLRPHDLHVFVIVAEQGNMAKAAEHLAISRPVVSKTIAGLEHTLGVRLLDRSAKGVAVTHYGSALLEHSLAVFDELRQGIEKMQFLADPNAGEVRFGCTEIMAAGVISSVVDQLSHTCPKLAFRMEIGDAAARVRLLRERRCEFVVARQELPGGQDDLDVRPLFYERPFVVAGPKSKWLGRRRLSLADLINEPWILTQRETHPNSPVFKAFQLSGVALPRVVVLSDSLNVRNSLLTDGRFLTVVPGSILRFGPERHLLTKLPIKLQSWPEPIALTTLKGRTLSPPAQLFIDCVHRLAEPLARQK